MKKSQKILYIVSLFLAFFFVVGLVISFPNSSVETLMSQYFKISMRYGESYFTQLFLIRGIMIFLLSLPFALLILSILRSADKEDFLRNKLPKVSFIFGILSFAFVWGTVTQLASPPHSSLFAITKVIMVIILPPLFLLVIPGTLGKKSFKSILFRSLVALLLLTGVIVIFGDRENQRRVDEFERSLPRNPYPPGVPIPPGEMQITSIADFSQDPILLGASHNVFVGRVLNQSGTKALGASPETQFQVEVIDNIKGELKGTVIVNQFGGYQNGTLVTVEEENDGTTEQGNNGTKEPYLLEPGATYLFATRYLEGENWYTVITSSYGRKLLSKDGNANVADLKTLAHNDERVKTLAAAYPNEKLLEADIEHRNTRNNYKDHEAKMKAEQMKATAQSTPPETAQTATDTAPVIIPAN